MATTSPNDVFRSAYHAPMLPGNVHLDLHSTDADGKLTAPEAALKSLVLISTSPTHASLTQESGRLKWRPHPVHVASGMAGVGKTTALIALGHDEDIQSHFIDGVLYMRVGSDATVAHITNELSKIMSVTGSLTDAEEVKSTTSLVEAVAMAALWFEGRRILFVIDDIWPARNRPEGFLPDLQEILRACPESRIAISTRSLHIATKRGSYVHFTPRDPHGQVSLLMFTANISSTEPLSESRLEAARGILALCAGLPLALSIAGTVISVRMKMGLEFEDACEMYMEQVARTAAMNPGASSLDNAIALSLATIETVANDECCEADSLSLGDLYTSLCVLKNQQCVPLPVLSRMWRVSESKAMEICLMFASMSLAQVFRGLFDGREQTVLSIHDLQLGYCRRKADESGGEGEWHRRLLNGHLNNGTIMIGSDVGDDVDGSLGKHMLEFRPRPWWEKGVPNKDYLQRHLSRHLQRAQLYLELGATALDFRWIWTQGSTGEVPFLKNDFDELESALERKNGGGRKADSIAFGLMESVRMISKALVAESRCFKLGKRVLAHEIFLYLFHFSQTNEWMHRFLERLKELVPRPFLEAVHCSNEGPKHDLKLHIELKATSLMELAYFSTDFSTCGKYCAAGSQHDVLLFCLSTTQRLAWLKAHEGNVSVVKFNSDASKVFSGSLDSTVIVWDWQKEGCPFMQLIGHDEAVTSLALSGDDSRLFSGSLDGWVRMWDTETGEFFEEFDCGAEVECVACNPVADMFSAGTRDGFLRCFDWVSGDCQFQYGPLDGGAMMAAQFGSDGKYLVCGTSLGNATAWRTTDGKQSAVTNVPGSLTHIAFESGGSSVVLGSSQGEIRHWVLSEKQLSTYNIAMNRPVNGISFRDSEKDVIVGVKYGYARAWSGVQINPRLDFEAVRGNLLFDFALSANGTTVATSTHDGMIRVSSTHTGKELIAYSAPDKGSRCLALNANGTKIASASPSSLIRIWKSSMLPSDSEVTFIVGDEDVSCLSFSPEDSKILVNVGDKVQIWNTKTRQKLRQIPNFESVDASFSADGLYVVVGNSSRAAIWNTNSTEKVFDTATMHSPTSSLRETTATSMSTGKTLSFPEAKKFIKNCGPTAHRMCPPSFRDHGSVSVELTVDNIFFFVNDIIRPGDMEFSGDVYVMNQGGVLGVYKMRR